MELGAKIGVKIRERDEGSGNKVKVCTVDSIHVYTGMQRFKYFSSHMTLCLIGLCDPT